MHNFLPCIMLFFKREAGFD